MFKVITHSYHRSIDIYKPYQSIIRLTFSFIVCHLYTYIIQYFLHIFIPYRGGRSKYVHHLSNGLLLSFGWLLDNITCASTKCSNWYYYLHITLFVYNFCLVESFLGLVWFQKIVSASMNEKQEM